MASTLTLNILLGVVGLGFVWCVWAAGLPSGPEGPVGAWIVPVPFLLLLLGVLVASIATGRLDWVPGGKLVAFVLLIGFLISLTSVIFQSFDRSRGALDKVFIVLLFVMLTGCVLAMNTTAWGTGRIVAATILGLTAIGGFGLQARTLLARTQKQMAIAEEQLVKETAERAERLSREVAEYNALPPDAPLTEVIKFEFAADPTVERAARERIANWPNLEDELAALLSSDHRDYSSQQWVISYFAEVSPAPTARLAPAYGRLLDHVYKYWEYQLKYSENPSKYEPELSSLIRGAERIQRAGGDLRPHLRPWYDLVKPVRGLAGLAGQIRALSAF